MDKVKQQIESKKMLNEENKLKVKQQVLHNIISMGSNCFPYNNAPTQMQALRTEMEGGEISDNSNKMITPSRIDEHEEYSSHTMERTYAINKEYSLLFNHGSEQESYQHHQP